MAKQRAVFALAPLALLLAPACHADWKFVPSVQATETYTDNVNYASGAAARSEWVTEVAPGFGLSNQGRRFQFDMNYRLRYFDRSGSSADNIDRTQSLLDARLYAELLDDLLYFDGNASIAQHAVSQFGPRPTDGDFGSANHAEVRTYRASPYLKHRFGATADMQLRYTIDAVDSDRRGLGDTKGQSLAFDLASGSNFGTFGWTLRAYHQVLDNEVMPDESTSNASLGLRYPFGRTFALTATAGYDKYDYDSLGGDTGGRAWTAGFTWTPSSRTRVDASLGRRYYGDSYYLAANYRTRRTSWTLNYDDSVTTTRAQFLLPSTVDTAALLDSLFAASVPDPVARRRAVDAYMLAAGLPPSLVDSINYFSNRHFLQKQLQATAAYRTARSNLLLSVFAVRRTALSTVDADSALLGPRSLTLNDATRQSGATAMWNLRLNQRNFLTASLNSIRVESESGGIAATHKTARLAMTRRFSRKLSGVLELRHTVGPASDGLDDYRANAVSASLNMQL